MKGPKRLKKGDKIALVATGSPFDKKKFDSGVRVLSSLGFEIKYHPLVFEQDGYLAGSDETRARVFTEAFLDDQVQAVFCVRGGYGTLRMLPYLDPGIFDRPKILLGYSDVTALLNFAASRGNLITFHGPMLVELDQLSGESFAHLFDLLSREIPVRFVPKQREVIHNGRVQGRLIGGNLTTLVHLLDTPYEPSWDGGILFAEDCGEALYRIDRLFTHLRLSGRLSKLAGIVLGRFTSGTNHDEVWDYAYKNLGDLKIPVVAGFPFGHGQDNMAVPVGGFFDLNAYEGVLELIEPCTTA